jgi:hypothetical protein
MATTLRHGAYWTEGEVSALLQAIKTNDSMTVIKNRHGRTEGAIMNMIRKIVRTYYYRDKLNSKQIQELTGLSEKPVNAVISEGPKFEKTDYIKRVKPSISNIMEFPITKERLHNISAEYLASKKKEIVDNFANTITENILSKAYKLQPILGVFEPAKDKRQHIVMLKNTRISPTHSNEYYIEDILAEMKRRFPDMVIVQDPLNTYILFDWN